MGFGGHFSVAKEAVLSPIWLTKRETAARVRGRIEQDFLPRGSELSALIRAVDWSTTNLGPIDNGAHLKSTVSLIAGAKKLRPRAAIRPCSQSSSTCFPLRNETSTSNITLPTLGGNAAVFEVAGRGRVRLGTHVAMDNLDGIPGPAGRTSSPTAVRIVRVITGGSLSVPPRRLRTRTPKLQRLSVCPPVATLSLFGKLYHTCCVQYDSDDSFPQQRASQCPITCFRPSA
ncbi:hypothetical protein ACVIHI_008325 [Bradyrhizobium sp. USDA 4524]|nr:hypothetical protein [Bradyrhizobium sp. USDA 4538]MCP1899315.1 hypothetical protein [Bradyrhizobium sp. USDA 4537]MCP1986573.1 hypothetical protein [Bradyrhizobium sp. USDA 4539]